MEKTTSCLEDTQPPPPPVSTRFRRRVNLETILKRKLNLDFLPKENAPKEPEPLPVDDSKFAFYKYMGEAAEEVVPSLCDDGDDSQEVAQEGFTPFAFPRAVIDHLENDPYTKQALTCPICYNWMRPPIYSCPSGHSACADCQRHLTMCPKALCMGQLATRSFALERVWNSLKVNCQECGVLVLAKSWDQHEQMCKESWSDL